MMEISSVVIPWQDQADFWLHHGRDLNSWQQVMAKVPIVLQLLSAGCSVDDCYEQYPDASHILFGKNDPIIIDSVQEKMYVSSGRHRIAMAQRMQIRYLPVIFKG